jgi:hypothetical protein
MALGLTRVQAKASTRVETPSIMGTRMEDLEAMVWKQVETIRE